MSRRRPPLPEPLACPVEACAALRAGGHILVRPCCLPLLQPAGRPLALFAFAILRDGLLFQRREDVEPQALSGCLAPRAAAEGAQLYVWAEHRSYLLH